MGKSGYTISPTIDQVDFLDHNVDKVLAVETMGMFHRLVQENAHKRFNTLIVGLKGLLILILIFELFLLNL